MSRLILIYSLCFFATFAFGATLHVSQQPLPLVRPDQQFRTIQEATKIARSGDLVIIHSGLYREAVVTEKSGTREKPIRFEAAPNSNVVVTGLERLSDWRKENNADNVYSTQWPYRFISEAKTDAYPDNEYHR